MRHSRRVTIDDTQRRILGVDATYTFPVPFATVDATGPILHAVDGTRCPAIDDTAQTQLACIDSSQAAGIIVCARCFNDLHTVTSYALRRHPAGDLTQIVDARHYINWDADTWKAASGTELGNAWWHLDGALTQIANLNPDTGIDVAALDERFTSARDRARSALHEPGRVFAELATLFTPEPGSYDETLLTARLWADNIRPNLIVSDAADAYTGSYSDAVAVAIRKRVEGNLTAGTIAKARRGTTIAAYAASNTKPVNGAGARDLTNRIVEHDTSIIVDWLTRRWNTALASPAALVAIPNTAPRLDLYEELAIPDTTIVRHPSGPHRHTWLIAGPRELVHRIGMRVTSGLGNIGVADYDNDNLERVARILAELPHHNNHTRWLAAARQLAAA